MDRFNASPPPSSSKTPLGDWIIVAAAGMIGRLPNYDSARADPSIARIWGKDMKFSQRGCTAQ